MITESKDSSSHGAAPDRASAKSTGAPSEGEKQTISPAERWLLINEAAYLRAQKRGFTGGDSYEDWVEAEQEVDARYATDTREAFTSKDAAELTEQFKNLFGGFGFGPRTLDELLKQHRSNLEELATQQTALLQDAVGEAMKTWQAFAHGKISTEGIAKQAELSTKIIENALSHFRTLTETVVGVSTASKKEDDKKK